MYVQPGSIRPETFSSRDLSIDTNNYPSVFKTGSFAVNKQFLEKLRLFNRELASVRVKLMRAAQDKILSSYNFQADIDWLTNFQSICVSFTQLLSIQMVAKNSEKVALAKTAKLSQSKSGVSGIANSVTCPMSPATVSRWLDSNLFARGVSTRAEVKSSLEESGESAGSDYSATTVNNSFRNSCPMLAQI